MSILSELVTIYKRERGGRYDPRRPSSRSPTARGLTRGSLGATGARLFQGRNSEAGAQKELEILNSPSFQGFINSIAPSTPILDAYRRARSGS